MSPIALPIAELLPALTGLGKVLRKRPTLPVLGMLKIERAPDGWITTDLDTFVSVRLEQPTAGEPLGLLVPCDDLGDPGDVDEPADLPERFRKAADEPM